MAELNNPVNAQNVVNRFADYVTTTANSGIVWGTGALPFTEWNLDVFGGDTSGKSIGISGADITADKITAQTIFDVLLAETATYTRIRNMRAQLFVTGDGGNTGSRPTPGTVFDEERVSHMNNTYLQTISSSSIDRSSVTTGNTINKPNLETLFTNLQTEYNNKRNITAGTFRVDVCHASCHSSCHGSRGRR